MNIKKLIAREGLILLGVFVSSFLITLIPDIYSILERTPRADISRIADTSSRIASYFWICYVVYWVVRFIAWAIRILKEKA